MRLFSKAVPKVDVCTKNKHVQMWINCEKKNIYYGPFPFEVPYQIRQATELTSS